MNELIRLHGIQRESFTNRVYHSATDYMISLLNLQSIQLEAAKRSRRFAGL